MRYLFIVITIELLLAALSVVVLYKTPPLYFVYVSISVAVMILAALLYHRLGIPIKKITTGMELLAAQDFSSQLRPTGQKDTDKIIGIFNSMMKQLRNQVLMNQEQNFFLKQLIDASPMGVITDQRIFSVGVEDVKSIVLSLQNETRPTAQSNPARSPDRQLRH